MGELQSNRDAILLAIPMLALVFVARFRMEPMLMRSGGSLSLGHPLSHVDSQGQFVCVEPNGESYVSAARGSRSNPGKLQQAHWRPGEYLSQKHVSVSWEEENW